MKLTVIKRCFAAAAAALAAAGAMLVSASPPADADGGAESYGMWIATSCAAFSPEGRAEAEWRAYINGYSSQREKECINAGLSPDAWRDGADRPEDGIYGSADETSRQRLREIAQKYGLVLRGRPADPEDILLPSIENSEQMCALYRFEDGSFGVSGRVDVSGWRCDFVYEECPEGVMGAWSSGGELRGKYSSWSHALPDGDKLWIDMGAPGSGRYSGYRQVLLYCSRDGRVITVRGEVPNGREGAEQFADCFLHEQKA